MNQAESEPNGDERGHQITFTVNKKPVTIVGPRHIGVEIKEAAIATGQPVELDFILSERQPNGRYQNVGDQDRVIVSKHSVFTLATDDVDS
jgi:hypothetical protein